MRTIKDLLNKDSLDAFWEKFLVWYPQFNFLRTSLTFFDLVTSTVIIHIEEDFLLSNAVNKHNIILMEMNEYFETKVNLKFLERNIFKKYANNKNIHIPTQSKTIKAIETIYKDCKFRSRLEARWAVFFDNMHIEWEYEPEGFELENGKRYLPDFYLPKFDCGIYCEVKPNGGDFTKAKQFVKDTGYKLWLCEGIPDVKNYDFYIYDNEKGQVILIDGVPNFGSSDTYSKFDGRIFWSSGISDDELKTSYEEWEQESGATPYMLQASRAAKQARFEFQGVTKC